MKATQQLHDLSQSLWLDNIARGLLWNEMLASIASKGAAF
jgi:hypothetical protein